MSAVLSNSARPVDLSASALMDEANTVTGVIGVFCAPRGTLGATDLSRAMIALTRHRDWLVGLANIARLKAEIRDLERICEDVCSEFDRAAAFQNLPAESEQERRRGA